MLLIGNFQTIALVLVHHIYAAIKSIYITHIWFHIVYILFSHSCTFGWGWRLFLLTFMCSGENVCVFLFRIDFILFRIIFTRYNTLTRIIYTFIWFMLKIKFISGLLVGWVACLLMFHIYYAIVTQQKWWNIYSWTIIIIVIIIIENFRRIFYDPIYPAQYHIEVDWYLNCLNNFIRFYYGIWIWVISVFLYNGLILLVENDSQADILNFKIPLFSLYFSYTSVTCVSRTV